MSKPIADLNLILRSLDPKLHEGVYVYTSVPFATDLSLIPVVGTVREDEGLTVILAEPDALDAGFPVLFRAAWITLSVNSALDAIGLTAAFSTALANAGISCNVAAGAHHDHIFVQFERAADAMTVLRDLANETPQI
jgi:hypothetical protein